MDIDALASEFGTTDVPPKADTNGFDVHSLAAEFGNAKPEAAPLKRVIIDTTPKPFTPEEAVEAAKPKANPRELLPRTNVIESIANNYQSGRDLTNEGVSDIQSGHPYKGLGKAALGVLGTVTSPVTGLVEGAVSTPITDITGNPDIGDRAGFVVNSALPVAPMTSKIAKSIPKTKAFETLIDSIGEKNLPAVVSQMKANPRLAPADLSPKVLQDTQHLFANDGPQIDYLAKTSANRMAGAKGAVETAYDSATGLPVNGVTKLKELRKAAQDVGSKEINPAISNANPVDITPVLTHIDDIVKPGVNKVLSSESTLPSTEINKQLTQIRSMLANEAEHRTNPEQLHNFQSILRQTADSLLNSSDGAARRMGIALMKVRNKLVDAIDAASPQVNGKGTYKPALEKYRDAKHIDDAFHQGYESIFTNSKKLEGRPEFTKQWFDGLSDAEKQAAREGARLQLDTTIHNTRFAARKGMEVPEADFNRQKLELLFGKKETDKLATALQHERTIANTHNKVIEGSQTAMRTASKEQFKLPTTTEVGKTLLPASIVEGANVLSGGVGGLGTAAYLTLKGAAKAKDLTVLNLAKRHNARYAEYALPTEGPSRDALIKAMEDRIAAKSKPSLMNKVKLALPVINP